MMKNKKNKSYFFPFLFFSTCLHLTVFYFVQKNSLWFYSPIKENKTCQEKIELPKKDKEKILKQFIATIPNNYSSSSAKKKENQVDPFNFKEYFFEERKIKTPKIKTPWPQAISQKLTEKNKNPISSINLFSNDKQFHLKELKVKTNFFPTKYISSTNKSIKSAPEDEKNYTFREMLSYSETRKIIQDKFPLNKQTPNLPIKLVNRLPSSFLKKTSLAKKITFSTLKDLRTFLYADDFDMEVSHIPSKEGGYIFAITLIPKYEIDLPRIPQHFTLLLDRSNSIQKNRLKASRDALYQAISFLKEEDSFNLIAFDSKMEKLFPTKRKLTNDVKKSARKFLINLKLGSFFASTNIYNPLYSSTYDNLNENHIHSIVLVSNGEGLTNKALQHRFMGQWTSFNAGRTSLFTISLENDDKLADLELISTLNRGWLVTSSTKGGLKRKVMKLMKTIQNPIIKDVECSYISTTGNKFELFRPYKGLPHLYKSEPYVIIGRCDKLDDFTLVLQGKNNEKWLNIKKNIPLKASKRGDRILLEQWALHKAWNCYADYLEKQDSFYLEKARKILEPLDMSPAFK